MQVLLLGREGAAAGVEGEEGLFVQARVRHMLSPTNILERQAYVPPRAMPSTTDHKVSVSSRSTHSDLKHCLWKITVTSSSSQT